MLAGPEAWAPIPQPTLLSPARLPQCHSLGALSSPTHTLPFLRSVLLHRTESEAKPSAEPLRQKGLVVLACRGSRARAVSGAQAFPLKSRFPFAGRHAVCCVLRAFVENTSHPGGELRGGEKDLNVISGDALFSLYQVQERLDKFLWKELLFFKFQDFKSLCAYANY